jgi:hypothetical protein
VLDTDLFTAGAVLCPHAEERARQTVYVRDPQGTGPPMGLCARCRTELGRLVTMRPRPAHAEVLATMVALGYREEDADQLWRELQEGGS